VASTTKALIEKNDNVLAMDIDDDIGEAYADLTKVRQILLNMVSNAAKFTSNGTITLFAKRYTEGEQDNLRLGVSDTGIGIPEDMLSKIFEEFTQADDSTTRSFGGTGLGLALVRRFCQMMGGNVWAESVVGEGSSFIVDIPAIVIDQDAVATVPESSSATLLTEPIEPLDTPTND
jgi:signal transduction histidine kinase